MYFCKIENFAYGEINERSFSNPHPWAWPVTGLTGGFSFLWTNYDESDILVRDLMFYLSILTWSVELIPIEVRV